MLHANYFKIDTRNMNALYHHSITIGLSDGFSISRRVEQRIVYLLTEVLRHDDESVSMASKYYDLLVSVKPLAIHEFPHTNDIRYFDDDERQARPDPEAGSTRRGPTIYPVKID